MTNLIMIGILLMILGSAIVYIVKQKKKGVHCIGCPAGGKCPSQNGGELCSCSSCQLVE